MTNSNTDMATLRGLVNKQGLLSPQPFHSTYQVLRTILILAGSLTFLVFFGVHSTWQLAVSAALLAFAFGQTSFVGHNINHGQFFSKRCWQQSVIEYAIIFTLCSSSLWWTHKHKKLHHAYPNVQGKDPDILAVFLRFSGKNTWRIGKFIEKKQGYIYLPAFFLEGLVVRYSSFKYLITSSEKRSTRHLIELFLMGAHIGAYVGGLFFLLDLSVWKALLFVGVHQALFGLYLALVFAPNHKGMAEMTKEQDTLRQQVLTARDVTSSRGLNWLLTILYGGLNYQIIHHLFPTMSQNKLGTTQGIVKDFCKHEIEYKKTGVLGSFWEILKYLGQLGTPKVTQ
jgi:fatty acid desaturase